MVTAAFVNEEKESKIKKERKIGTILVTIFISFYKVHRPLRICNSMYFLYVYIMIHDAKSMFFYCF
jgi:hypothetical protein